MRPLFLLCRRRYRVLLHVAALTCGSALVLAQVNVSTSHNDNARTGANLAESTLTTSNVNVAQFGKLYARTVDDQIYAQPLYMAGVNIAGVGIRDVVYVATVNDSVYAFDADDPGAAQPLWKIAYANPPGAVPVRNTDVGQSCGTYVDFSGNIGIVGTPVIDPASQTMYLVARTKEGAAYVQRLHAIDITNGSERMSPVTIDASVPGTGDGSNAQGMIPFNPRTENQRAALLLDHGTVYVAWASHCDQGPYHGWIIGYDAATMQQVMVYNTTPEGGYGGIWQSGGGLSADPAGNVYALTGNGTFSTNGADRGNSFIKISPAGVLLDWFTPYNWSFLNSTDEDLGIQRALLIPDTNLVVGGGKEGVMYVVDRTNMGHTRPGDNSQIVQSFQASSASRMNGSPVYWNGPVYGPAIYVWPAGDPLKVFRLVSGRFQVPASAQSTVLAAGGMPGGLLSLSANGNAAGTAVVWAAIASGDANHDVEPGILRAMDASNVTRELWNSEQNAVRDGVGNFAKFSPPTIADGKVFLATFSNSLVVYGLLGGSGGNAAPFVSAGPDQTVTLPNTVVLAGSATDDGKPNPPGTLTSTWSMVSGPAPVTFGNPNQPSTTATFTAAGVYTLRLSASDTSVLSFDDVIVVANATTGSGSGLFAQYFNDAGNNTFFTALVVTRIDPSLDFSWSSGSPASGVQSDNFSARWSGLVVAPVSGAYTFTTTADDGVRLWVDNQLLIDDWVDQPLTTTNATIALTAGVSYDLRLEYFDHTGAAAVKLLWAYPGQAQQGIPTARLFPAVPVNQPPAVDAGPDQTTTLPAVAALLGRAQDDGLPSPPSRLTVTWSKISGREDSSGGTVVFGNPNALQTTAAFGADGIYVLRLTVSDGAVTISDDVTVTVKPATGGVVGMVQASGVASDSAAGSIGLSFGGPISTGSLIVAAVSWGKNSSLTCSDTQGNAYAVLPLQFDSTNNQSLGICYAANAKGGFTTFSATFGGVAEYRKLLIHEYVGVASSSPVDVTSASIANATTATDNVTTTNGTTTTAGDLIFAAVVDDTGSNNITAGTGFALRTSVNNSDLASEDRLAGGAGPAAATFSFSAAHRYSARMVAFKAASTDSTPPQVDLTAPSAGAAVSGNVLLTATASDNIGVAGLQFKIDSVSVGAEITNGNYTLMWDSTTKPNGSHSVTAVARDGGGNVTTSNAITIDVNNIDTTPPGFQNVTVTGVTTTSATITWTTTEPATTQVQYGLDTSYALATALNPALTGAHSQVLSGLLPGATYYFKALSSDAAGNAGASAGYSFVTPTPDTTPPLVSSVNVTGITVSSATITWLTNEVATSQVNYGLSTTYGVSTTRDITYVLSHSQVLTNLQAGTGYHVQTVSSDAQGNTGLSADVVFTTLAGEPAVPVVGLVGRWKLNEASGTSAPDSAGTSPGTLGNFACATTNCSATSGWTSPGRFAGALNFDGTNDVVTVTAKTGLNDLASFSYSAWIFPRALGEGSAGRIIDKSGTGYKRFRLNNATAGSFYAEVRLGTTNAVATSPANAVTLNQWQHVVMTFDGPTKTLRIYKDGVQIASATGAGNPQSDATGNLLIGNNAQGNATFNGLVDDVIVYNRALALSEIQSLASGVPDVTPPQISAVSASGVTMTSAAITWNTNEASDTRVEYGPTSDYGATTVTSPALVQSHTVTLSGLTPGADYHFRVLSSDSSGNSGFSGDVGFTTLPPDVTPPIITSVNVTGIGWGDATITWTTNEPSSTQVNYGLSSDYGVSTTKNTAAVTSHSQALTGLQPATQYHVQVISTDAFNNTSLSDDVTFTTVPGEPAVPTAGVVSRWKFNEASGTSASDSAGTSPGTLGNFACTTINCNATSGWTNSGRFVRALNFDGANDVVTVTANASVNDLASFSYAAWIFPRTLGEGSAGRIIDKSGTGFKRFRLNNATASSFYGEVRLGTTNAVATSAANTVTLNQWQHVVMVFDGPTKTLKIYKNGVQVATGTGAGNPQSDANGNVLIGNNANGSATFNGMIDDVLVYNRALALTEIQTLASGAPDLTPPSISAVNVTGLTTTAATMTWNTDEISDSVVAYGLSTDFGATTPVNAALVQAHSVLLSNLTPGSTYFVRVFSRDTSGNLGQFDFSFTTLPPEGLGVR